VEYIGSVGPDERNSLLGNAEALLHPIFFEEPFGLSIIEAMACGTPVIAFNRGSMPELIPNNKCGFLVENVKDAVEAVGNVGQINRADCRKHVEEHFTIEKMVGKYEKIYENVLEKKLNSVTKFA